MCIRDRGKALPNKIPAGAKISGERILAPRSNLALRNCRTAVHFLLPLFQKIYNQLFHKRLRAGVLPLTPYNTAKSKNDGLSGKNFSGGSVFPDNKAFRKPVSYTHLDVYKRQNIVSSISDSQPHYSV